MQLKQKRWQETSTSAVLFTSPRQMEYRMCAAASHHHAHCPWLVLAMAAELLCSCASSVPNAMSCQERGAKCLSFSGARSTKAKKAQEGSGRGEVRASPGVSLQAGQWPTIPEGCLHTCLPFCCPQRASTT